MKRASSKLVVVLLLMVAMAPLVGAILSSGSNQNAPTTDHATTLERSQPKRPSPPMYTIPQMATPTVMSSGTIFSNLRSDFVAAGDALKTGPVVLRSGGAANPLANGVSVTGFLNGTSDYETWYIDVSSGAREMRSVLTCPNSVDFDLYGKLGAYPTTSSYDWIGYNWGSDDVSYNSPAAGRWYIMPYSLSGKGTYLLTVTVLYTSSVQPLTNGTTVTGSLNATADSDLWYIDVNSDATSMRSVLTCPVNTDFDLYGSLGAYPTTDSYYWRSNVCGGEDITYDHPGAGRWYIMPYSYLGNGTYQLTVTITYPPVVQLLSSGVTVTGSLNVSGEYDLWCIYVNSGATMMHAVLSCPSGANFDLYGNSGSYPTTSYYNWRGVTNGSEDVTYSSPSSGSWYIMVTSSNGNGTYQLTVTVTYNPKIGILTSGSPVTGSLNLSHASDMWYIYVSGGALRIHSVLTCPNGTDFYLYGAYYNYPNTTYYTWAGTASGGQDVTYNYPDAGKWYILVYAFNGSGAYQLTVTVTGPSSIQSLTSGVTLMGDLSGPAEYDIWYIEVPAGATSMRSVLTCPNFANFDIYGQYQSYPNTTSYTWAGTGTGDENVVYTYPRPGYWYIMVYSFSGNGTYSLTVTVDYGGQVPVDPTALLASFAVIFIVILVFIILLASSRGNTLGSGRGSNYLPSRAPNQLPLEDERERQQLAAARMLQCKSCGASLKPSDNNCWNCGAPAKAGLVASSVPSSRTRGRIRSGICMVCKRGLEKGDEILFCPHCGGLAHKDHMLEWLHVKDYCPTCGRHLDEAEVRKQTDPESGSKSKRRRH